jgi:tRNA pseudouridine38-40 synthase
VVLGVSYRGQAYQGWQSQPSGKTVQDRLEAALARFADRPLRTVCAGRTDTGVHALNQVVHLDTEALRTESSWVRGTNRFLPSDIAVQWCKLTDAAFHARYGAIGRRYVYVLLESAVRPAVEAGSVGWSFRPLNADAMRSAAQRLLGEHDFSAFRSSECQAPTPVRTIHAVGITRRGAYWRFEFDANAFLHHMVRNIVGALVYVGAGKQPPAWIAELLAAQDRRIAAPTFAPDGLYLAGVAYDPAFGLPGFRTHPLFDPP